MNRPQNNNNNKRMANFHELLILRLFSESRDSYNKIEAKKDNLVILRFRSSEDTTIIQSYVKENKAA